MAKYIVMETYLGLEAYIFSESTNHSDMARGLPGIVSSAGFLKVSAQGISCHGKSHSLGVSANLPRDNKLVSQLLKFN